MLFLFFGRGPQEAFRVRDYCGLGLSLRFSSEEHRCASRHLQPRFIVLPNFSSEIDFEARRDGFVGYARLAFEERLMDVTTHGTQARLGTCASIDHCSSFLTVGEIAWKTFILAAFCAVGQSEPRTEHCICVCHRVVSEPSSNCDELQLLLSHVFRVSLCPFSHEQRNWRWTSSRA